RAAAAGPRYQLTDAGQALAPIIDALGEWGYRWAAKDLRPEHLNPDLLMWFLRRRGRTDKLPEHRTVVRFEFHADAPRPGVFPVLPAAGGGPSFLCTRCRP